MKPFIAAADVPSWAQPPEPLPLARELDPATPFPVEALGTVGAAVVEQMHAVIQAPQALIGQSILAAMNQVAQPFANVIIDGRVSPLSDFFLTLGESGERKSAVDAWALAQVREHQRALMLKYRSERDEFEQAALIHDTQTKLVLADKKLSSEAKQARLAETPRPTAPVMPLFIVSEPSTEAIQRQLIIGLPSIGLVNDEGGQFLGGYAMSAEKRLGTLTTLSRLWDRGEFDRVRVGDGSGSYYGRRLTGTTLIREWDERQHRVTVTPEGLYELNGQVFKSLSAAARHITGTQWNGPKFFGLRDGKAGAR